jgi:hypothetical protein
LCTYLAPAATHSVCVLQSCNVCIQAFPYLPASLSFLQSVQLREDVTRFRYGDEQHLDDTLTRIFM